MDNEYSSDSFDLSAYAPTVGSEWDQCFSALLDPSVSEIVANGPNSFFMKQSGKRIPLNISLISKDKYINGIREKLVSHISSPYPFNEDKYLFEGRLDYTSPEGQTIRCRAHIVLSPASDYPQVTIAKKSNSLNTIESIAAQGSMSEEMLQFLKLAVKARLNIVFSGGTGAGKTTALEALTKLIPDDVRIGVAEDTPELVLIQENVTFLHSVPWRPSFNPNDVATLSWCVSQFQRMRIDRIIVGETRGVEFNDWLTAANSGMDGSLTTIHANTPVMCLDKMSNFAMMARGNQPTRTVNMDVAHAVDLIVQLIILPDGRHKVGEITQVTDTVSGQEDAKITTQLLYKYNMKNDTFMKESLPVEGLRQKFANAGIDLVNALPGKTRVESPPAAPRQTMGNYSSPSVRTGGLPIPQNSSNNTTILSNGLPTPTENRGI